jgi:hypothetical protein
MPVMGSSAPAACDTPTGRRAGLHGAVPSHSTIRSKGRIAAIDAVCKYAQSILDWDELDEAVKQLVEEQKGSSAGGHAARTKKNADCGSTASTASRSPMREGPCQDFAALPAHQAHLLAGMTPFSSG